MAARWGAGEETLTIGGMELFTAGGPLQCHDLEEDETCDGLSDLALSSLDAGGILGTFQGYIDNSIISIIDDPGALAEQKDHFDEENELSLLTALTEILDNADDENISPFDIIPDTELLVSPKDRDGSMTFLALSRTPPEHEMFSVNGQRRADSNKIDGLYSGPNWELFPDIISSTPKRRSRQKSVRACLPRRAEAQETHQRSDGEDEDVPCPADVAVNSGLLAVDENYSTNTETDSNDGDREQILMQRTPCIINTENVALNELVKYMHPYCLPAITVCLESEEDKSLLSDAVFLEIVSEQGECIKVPVVVEPPEDMLCSESSDTEGMDGKAETLPNRLPSSEERAPELAMNNEKQVDSTEKLDEIEPEAMENYGAGPKLPDTCVQPPASDILVKSPDDDETCKSEEIVPDRKKNGEAAITVSVAKEKVPPKGKRSSKDKQPCKSKGKSRMKSITGGKSPDRSELIPVQSITQPPACRVSNPSLQESDFLTKTLDQVKESQMELRSSKIGRTKPRTRESLDGSNPEIKSAAKKVKPVAKESEQTNGGVRVVDNDKDLESSPKPENSKTEESQDSAAEVEGLQSEQKDVKMLVASDICSGEEPSSPEESGASKLEDVPDGDSLQLNKETKPKLLSLSEYRKRLQHRKPNPDRDNENQSCSKWPSVPEPPTELAELPCLIVPTHSNKLSVEEKACPQRKHSNVSAQDAPVSSASVPVVVIPTPVGNQHVQQLNEKPYPAVVDVVPPPMNPQPTMPPSFHPPAWPTVPPHPSFYPGMPPLPGVPHYPIGMPLQPPPIMSWPPFPPIVVPPVHPTSWVSGPPTPYWPNAQMAQGMPESQSLHSSPEKSVRPNPHMLSDQKMMQETIVAPVESRPQPAILPVHGTAVPKPDGVGQQQPETAAKPETSHGKSPTPDEPQIRPGLTSSLPMKADKSQTAIPSASKLANVSIPDLKSANKVVIKIMEILKKAQKLGFQLKPSSNSVIGNTQLGVQIPPSAQPKQEMLTDVNVQVVDINPTEETSAPITEEFSVLEKSDVEPAAGNMTAQKVAEDELAASCIGSKQESKEPVVIPCVETLCTSEESLQRTAESDLKDPEEGFSCEAGIEASDLSSLLEQFEKSEAKEEERLSQSPDEFAVGNSWTEKTLEKKIPDKLTAELVNTAGLTPPATPPHQLWKSLVAGPSKSKALQGQERTRSPLKTTKLIEPLPQGRLKNRSLGSASSVAVPPIHVASGDHDYCILTNQCAKNKNSATAVASPAPPSQCEEGSRWNVKHHQNITIKPIVQFNKRQQSEACPKRPAPSAPLVVANQSTTCDPAKPVTPCGSIQKATCAPLDHRTNVTPESAVTSPPASVLMSPDSSPCRSDNRENRTDLKRGSASVSRRALRCYRKYKGSPSPQKSSWRGRSSGSRSDSRSSSSSSSRSRSRSPALKRRRTSRYRSRSRHRSRSSSRSSCGSSSSSRSSSRSSRLCSPPSSRSRSRSRSPYRRRYRSRSRRCESRESYNRRRMYHKERAIEERRVVYIGKINNLMTRAELRRRFSVFGEIEECTIHFREEGDNYGFVTYCCTREAFAAIENGHKLCLPDELPFDLCFGGRRQFCRSNYADLDSNRDDFDPAPVRSKFESLDFDTLLKQAQKSHRR